MIRKCFTKGEPRLQGYIPQADDNDNDAVVHRTTNNSEVVCMWRQRCNQYMNADKVSEDEAGVYLGNGAQEIFREVVELKNNSFLWR